MTQTVLKLPDLCSAGLEADFRFVCLTAFLVNLFSFLSTILNLTLLKATLQNNSSTKL
jgi:hypothetical protein